jgi:hypothetical protein
MLLGSSLLRSLLLGLLVISRLLTTGRRGRALALLSVTGGALSLTLFDRLAILF